MQYISSSRTDVGKVRSANEDNMGNAQTSNGHVFVVCDGMGGHVGGATASNIAVTSILEYFQKDKYDNIIQAIDRSLVFANEQVYARSLAEPELKGMGTTALVLVVKGEECFIGHVGDSRIYLKSDGKLNRLTKDHSFVQTLVDAGVISDEDAESHPNKNQILKAMGISPILEPTICEAAILPKNGDVFLLCSDGLNGMVNDKTIEMMLDAEDLNLSTTNLINAALEAGGHDNVTVTLVGITDSPHKVSQFKDFNPKQVVVQAMPAQENKKVGSKKLLVLIASAAVILASVVAGFFFLRTEKEVELKTLPAAGKSVTLEQIQIWPEKQIDSLSNYKIACKDTTIKASNDKFLVEIVNHKAERITRISKDSRVKEEPKKVIKQDKDGKEKGDADSSKVNSKQSPNSMDTTVIPPNKVSSCNYNHKVIKGESLSSIVDKLNSTICSNLKQQVVFDANKKRLKYKSVSNIKEGDVLKGTCDCHE